MTLAEQLGQLYTIINKYDRGEYADKHEFYLELNNHSIDTWNNAIKTQKQTMYRKKKGIMIK